MIVIISQPHYFRVASLIILFYLTFFSAFAQSGNGVESTGTNGQHTINGRIYFPSGRASDSKPKITLQVLSSGELHVFANDSGEFSFKNLSPGNYTVVIEAGDNYETARESITIDSTLSLETIGGASGNMSSSNSMRRGIPQTFTIPINLRLKGVPKTKNAILSAEMANVPKPALKAYEKGLEAIKQNNSANAVDEFNKAIKLYPQFIEAYNDLSSHYLKSNELDKATETIKKALSISPSNFQARTNYGILLLYKKQPVEAERELLTATQKNENAVTAHLYHAIALVGLNRVDEAEKEFKQVLKLNDGTNTALAHKYLGGIYWQRKQYAQAADELEKYLKSNPKAAETDKIQKTIKELREKVK